MLDRYMFGSDLSFPDACELLAAMETAVDATASYAGTSDQYDTLVTMLGAAHIAKADAFTRYERERAEQAGKEGKSDG